MKHLHGEMTTENKISQERSNRLQNNEEPNQTCNKSKNQKPSKQPKQNIEIISVISFIEQTMKTLLKSFGEQLKLKVDTSFIQRRTLFT